MFPMIDDHREAYKGEQDEPIIPPYVLEQFYSCVHPKADADDRQGAQGPSKGEEPWPSVRIWWC